MVDLNRDDLIRAARKKPTSHLILIKQLFTQIIEQHSDDPRVSKVQMQVDIINDELERRGQSEESMNNEQVIVNEDGTKDITIGMNTLRMSGKVPKVH